jgi:hypothetical protein
VLAAVSNRGPGFRSGAGSSEMGGPSSSIASGRVMERGVGRMLEGMWCGHDVRKPPRKVGRRIVGYVYEKEEREGNMNTSLNAGTGTGPRRG